MNGMVLGIVVDERWCKVMEDKGCWWRSAYSGGDCSNLRMLTWRKS